MIEAIRANGQCHGCGACVASLAPGRLRMELIGEGFLRPKASTPLSEAEGSVVEKVCSGRELVQPAANGGRRHPLWGRLDRVTVGHATDPDVRFRGSSGGSLSAIAIYLLERGLVDFVLHTARAADDPFGNNTRPSFSRSDVLEASGSRYAPSAPLADLPTYLDLGKKFAFIGRPCDVAALRRLAAVDARVDTSIPIVMSFFCAGTPSQSASHGLATAMGVPPGEVSSFDYRGRGWPGLARAVAADGSERTMDYNSSWGKFLSRHIQFRCKICPDGVGEFADIVCADAWYGAGGYPDFAERDGRSLILARTAVGVALLADVAASKQLHLEPIAVDEIAAMQPFQALRRKAVKIRLVAMRLRGYRPPTYRGFHLLYLSLRSSPMWLAINFLGTLRRLKGIQ